MRFKKSILGVALAAVASTAVLGSAIAQNTVVPGDPGATANTPAPAARPETKPAPARPDGERRHARADRGDESRADRFERAMERRIGWMVDKVGGTAEQKARIVAIMKASMADQAKLRGQAREARAKLAELLKAPTLDRAAIEQQRSQLMAIRDQQSRRMTAAMTDSAEVLTPEQRAKVAELRERGGPRGARHHHPGHGPRGEGPHGGPRGDGPHGPRGPGPGAEAAPAAPASR